MPIYKGFEAWWRVEGFSHKTFCWDTKAAMSVTCPYGIQNVRNLPAAEKRRRLNPLKASLTG